MKVCSRCKIEKPRDEFYKNERYRDGLGSDCKACRKVTKENWRRKYPERAKAYDKKRHSSPEFKARRKLNRIKETYGITLEQKHALLKAQGGCCAICKTADPTPVRKNQDPWFVDHCHAYEESTGGIKIRGILCCLCNFMLGNAKDSRETLLAAVQYINKHSI